MIVERAFVIRDRAVAGNGVRTGVKRRAGVRRAAACACVSASTRAESREQGPTTFRQRAAGGVALVPLKGYRGGEESCREADGG